ncbi:MAG TPA: twin-arginine translocase subunit TatC [Candidatus Polarisedimenticolaceae bacterium]|nr:twin-arginine translocase subunit TatC [Candidatus Polarisedimenticolaceae bacterium]
MTKATSQRSRQRFIDHVGELRQRLFWWVLVFIGGSGLGYLWREPVQDLLAAPLHQPLYYTSPAGGFNFVFQICLLFGLFVSLPVLVYQLLRFIQPAMPNPSKKVLVVAVISSIGLAMAGANFAYFISLPAALHFLTAFAPEGVKALISTDAYMSFIGWYLVGFAILFQLPLLMLLINKVTPLGPGSLLRKLPAVTLASFIVAAVLTPTADPLNQTLMAGPIIALYLLTALLIGAVNWRPRTAKSVRTQPVDHASSRQPAELAQPVLLAEPGFRRRLVHL